MASKAAMRGRIAKAARELAVLHKDRLDALKAHHEECARPDFLWHFLLQSFATMGGSAGWAGLVGDPSNYSRVTFEAVERIPATKRHSHIRQACSDAKVRWPDRKAGFLVSAFDRIAALGGLAAANKALFEAPGRAGKLKFLASFKGIGPKYARNIMMDVYHEDFRSSIAIDSRITALSDGWGLTFESYEAQELFYLEVAKEAGLNGWELDRLLYNFHDEFAARVVA